MLNPDLIRIEHVIAATRLKLRRIVVPLVVSSRLERPIIKGACR